MAGDTFGIEEIYEDDFEKPEPFKTNAATSSSDPVNYSFNGDRKQQDRAAARIQARYRGKTEQKKYQAMRTSRKKETDEKFDRMSKGLSATPTAAEAQKKSSSGGFGLDSELGGSSKASTSNYNPSGASYGAQEARSATRIQSQYRGRKARQSYQKERASRGPAPPTSRPTSAGRSLRSPDRRGGNNAGLSDYLLERQSAPRVANRPLNAPPLPTGGAGASSRRGVDEDRYATKIQSRYRGHMARKEVQDMRGGSKSRALAPARTEYGRPPSHVEGPSEGGWVGAAPALKMWENFAYRQKDRLVPLPVGPQRRLGSTGGYRLRIQEVVSMPLPVGKDYIAKRTAAGAMEFRVGISLFDEHTGQFYGTTCNSVPTVPRAAKEGDAPGTVSLDLQFDAYFHTDISDPKCIAVAEIVIAERGDGLVVQEFSLGWAALPLVTDTPSGPSAPTASRQSYLMAGSPRYLMFQGLPNSPPPRPLGSGVLSYELEAYPALLRCAALIPANSLVTYGDVIPGLRRFGRDGALTLGTKNVTSSLASPMLSPLRAVVIRGLCVALPPAFHRILSTVELGNNPDISEYELRVGVHNGRAFTAPCVRANTIEQVSLPSGGTILQMDEDLFVEELLDDNMVAVVIELVYTGARKCEPCREEWVEDADGGIVVGWAPVMPFDRLQAGDSAVREGRYDLTLRSGPGRWVRDVPLLDWRSKLTKGYQALPAPPKCFFNLEVTEPYGRDGRDPALEMSGQSAEAPRPAPGLGDVLEESGPQLGSPTKSSSPPQVASPKPAASPVVAAQPVVPRPARPVREEASVVSVVAQQQQQQLGGIANLQQQQLNQLSALNPPKGALDLIAQQQQTQLAQLAEAMQSQLNQLSTTLEGLQAPRHPLPAHAQPTAEMEAAAAAAIQAHFRGSQVRNSLSDVERLAEQAAGHGHGQGAALFSGGTAEDVKTGTSGVSRATRARLAGAGDVDALPTDVRALLRQRPAGGSPSQGLADMSVEAADVRAVNEIVVQLVAFKRHDALNTPEAIPNLYFTFQFYDFPSTTTQRARLEGMGARDDGTYVLVRDRKGEAEPDTGLVFKYTVDGADGDENTDPYQLQDRRMHFCRYLSTRSLSVDVWDGASQLQLGTAQVDLRGLLRQGREFAEVFTEVHVVDHGDFNPGEEARNRERRAALNSATGGHPVSLARGQLLLRLVNIGKLPGGVAERLPPPGPPGGAARVQDKKRRVRVKSAVETGGAIAAELVPDAGHVEITRTESGLPTSVRVKGGAGGRAGQGAAIRDEVARAEQRKLARRKRLAEMGSHQGATAARPEDQERDLRGHMLADIEHARERRRREMILGQLQRGMSATRVVRPSYGELIFFEHEFRNPFSRDAVFSIEISDPDLVLVTSTTEWRHLRQAVGAEGGGAEEDALAGNRLYLAGDERCFVPFKFQCFSYQPMPLGGKSRHTDQAGSSTPELPFPPRRVKVELVCIADGRPGAVLEVEVRPRPLVVDRTMRFHGAEGDFLRRRVRLPEAPEGAGGGELIARCSDDRATVGTSGGGNKEVWVKVKCGSAPESRRFYVVLYADRYMSKVFETWQVYTHALKRVDMAAATGQTSRASVVVRGASTSRRVRAYSSHPDELQVTPEGMEFKRGASFMLVAGALHELTLGFRPLVPGRLDVLVHIVDEESGEKVQALLVATEAHAPTVSKTFEVDVIEGAVEHKKITFTNPYNAPHSFHLRCTHPWLVHFRPERLDMSPHGTRAMGLTFDARDAAPGVLDAMVFVNDEDDKNEDCFRVRIRVIAGGAQVGPSGHAVLGMGPRGRAAHHM